MKMRSQVARVMGNSRGRITRRNVVSQGAPQTEAASPSVGAMLRMAPLISRNMKAPPPAPEPGSCHTR